MKNQEIKDYLTSNTDYLYGNYQEVADKFSVSYDVVRKLARVLRTQTINQKVEGPSGYAGKFKSGKVWQLPNGEWRESIQYQKEDIDYKEELKNFFKTYEPKSHIKECKDYNRLLPNGCLIINPQDAHYNKYDESGNNNIEKRFNDFHEKLVLILQKASTFNNLEKIIYIIGSDIFNSEANGFTTKGTPQTNVLDFHRSFKKVCNHEWRIINTLLQYAPNIEVTLVSGNHSEILDFHLVYWLQAYFRDVKGLVIDITTDYRKYIKYSNTALQFNHGDCLKAEKLAMLFPQEFKKEWSSCNNYYSFVGDKHHEMSKDLNGIKFFQLPALSGSKSNWDLKNGYCVSKPELKAFIIEENIGMTTILNEYL
jgi:peptide methionine sulfoxide reductase MsrA